MPEPNWWAAVVGDEPETRTSNPRQKILQEEGPYGDARLGMAHQQGRVDWIIGIAPSPTELPDSIPTLGGVNDALKAYRAIAQRWFELSPSLVRFALGAVLLQPSPNKETAYGRITEYVPGLRLDTPGCSDFMFQINRPRVSAIDPALKINRLVKWSVAGLQRVRLSIAQGIPVAPQQISFASRAELDINTAADRAVEIDHAQLPSIFDEMVGMLLEIGAKGDIP